MSGSPQETSTEVSEDLRWEPLVLTPSKVEDLWRQLQNFPIVFDDFSKGNFNDFLAKLCARQNIFVDIGPGKGLAAGFAVRPGLDAVIHLVMFDGRLRGREPFFREILGYYFNILKLRRMTIMLAEDARTGIKLAERMGFKLEGVMRKSIKRDGKLFDTRIYGILREEFFSKSNVEVVRGDAKATS